MSIWERDELLASGLPTPEVGIMNSEGMDFLRLIAYTLTAATTGIVMVLLILIATH
jgi:hypothetical protein